MKNDVLEDDFPRLRLAILQVIEAAKSESQAMRIALDRPTDETMHALRDTHMRELDTVQALAAALELFDRRLVRQGGRTT